MDYDQHLLDLAFADLDYLLDTERKDPARNDHRCPGCNGSRFNYATSSSSHPGSSVCIDCGVVQSATVIFEQMYGVDLPRKSSNYKRIHHWHERISQLLLLESQIPPADFLRIVEKLCDGTYTHINKDIIRTVLRSLNMQLYIEKWLQIIHRMTGVTPPTPGSCLILKLDSMFQDLQEPFESVKGANRKNFLNYNYVFCRLLHLLDCGQFSMFFPLIKSKLKLKQLDTMWEAMIKPLKWQLKPLEVVAPFSVRLEQPALLLQKTSAQCALPSPVVPGIAPLRMVFRTSGRPALKRRPLDSELLRSDQPARSSRTKTVARKRPRLLSVKYPR